MTDENEGRSFGDFANKLNLKRGIRLSKGQNMGLGVVLENDGRAQHKDVTKGADARKAQGSEPIDESVLDKN